MDQSSVVYKWLNTNELYIDGRAKNITEMFRQAEELRENPKEEEEDSTQEVLTYYEQHDFSSEEYYGAAVTSAPVVIAEEVTDEQTYE